MEQEKKNCTNQSKGLVIVYTGNGKGKTTAAMGMLMRAWGRDMKVAAIQFIKDDKNEYGESLAAKRMGIEIYQVGDGCTWQSRDMQQTMACGRNGWEFAKQKIREGCYDILLLDEFTYLFYFEWLEIKETIAWLRQNKPSNLHLVITGRYAAPELIQYANLVTEMREVKHPFQDEGLLSQPGVDY